MSIMDNLWEAIASFGHGMNSIIPWEEYTMVKVDLGMNSIVLHHEMNSIGLGMISIMAPRVEYTMVKV
jgi:hypothetical protein